MKIDVKELIKCLKIETVPNPKARGIFRVILGFLEVYSGLVNIFSFGLLFTDSSLYGSWLLINNSFEEEVKK